MSLIKDILKELESIGLDIDKAYKEKIDNGYIISFDEEIEKDVIYNIEIVIYDDLKLVEIRTRKAIDIKIDTLQKLNELNMTYLGYSFFIENNNVLSIKSICHTDSSVAEVMKALVESTEIAKIEFNNFD